MRVPCCWSAVLRTRSNRTYPFLTEQNYTCQYLGEGPLPEAGGVWWSFRRALDGRATGRLCFARAVAERSGYERCGSLIRSDSDSGNSLRCTLLSSALFVSGSRACRRTPTLCRSVVIPSTFTEGVQVGCASHALAGVALATSGEVGCALHALARVGRILIHSLCSLSFARRNRLLLRVRRRTRRGGSPGRLCIARAG